VAPLKNNFHTASSVLTSLTAWLPPRPLISQIGKCGATASSAVSAYPTRSAVALTPIEDPTAPPSISTHGSKDDHDIKAHIQKLQTT
jgi:hypothetical protein